MNITLLIFSIFSFLLATYFSMSSYHGFLEKAHDRASDYFLCVAYWVLTIAFVSKIF